MSNFYKFYVITDTDKALSKLYCTKKPPFEIWPSMCISEHSQYLVRLIIYIKFKIGIFSWDSLMWCDMIPKIDETILKLYSTWKSPLGILLPKFITCLLHNLVLLINYASLSS
jgi:hypothetical protein